MPRLAPSFSSPLRRAAASLRRTCTRAATGPDGGTLAIDVGCFGARDAPKALLILSGTHGGEGYTGSAAQIALLAQRRAAQPAGRYSASCCCTRINPYGFAHWTRTTENNVDLNRNFIDFSARLPRNDAYLELHDAICPASGPSPRVPRRNTRSMRGSRATASRHGCRRS